MRFRGFTILEVLVALAIFGMAAVMLATGYINVLNAYSVAGRGNVRDDNVRFARSLLIAEPDRKKAEQGDDFDAGDGVHVKWQATIEPTTTADLFRVEFVCDVSDPNSTTTRGPTKETFMLLRPTWSEGTDTAKLRANAKDRILELKKRLP
jgi:general secretion pathway protein I